MNLEAQLGMGWCLPPFSSASARPPCTLSAEGEGVVLRVQASLSTAEKSLRHAVRSQREVSVQLVLHKGDRPSPPRERPPALPSNEVFH